MSLLVPGPRRRGRGIEHVAEGTRNVGIDSIVDRQTSPRNSLPRDAQLATGGPSYGGSSISGIHAGGSLVLEAFDGSQKTRRFGGSLTVQMARPAVAGPTVVSPLPSGVPPVVPLLSGVPVIAGQCSSDANSSAQCSQLAALCLRSEGLPPPSSRATVGPSKFRNQMCPVSPRGQPAVQRRHSASPSRCSKPQPVVKRFVSSPSPDPRRPPGVRTASSIEACRVPSIGYQFRGSLQPPTNGRASSSSHASATSSGGWQGGCSAPVAPHELLSDAGWCSQPRTSPLSARSADGGRHPNWHPSPSLFQRQQAVGAFPYPVTAGGTSGTFVMGPQRRTSPLWTWHDGQMPADDPTVCKVPASLQALVEEQHRAEENARLDTLLRTTVEVLSLEAGYMEDGCLEPLSPGSAHMSVPETPELSSEVQAATGSACKDEYTWADVLPSREVPAAILPQDDDATSASPATSPPNEVYSFLIEPKEEPALRLLTMEDVRQRHEGGRTLFYIALNLM